MKNETLIKLINKGESETLEFKKSFDRETIETISAFSNSNGGIILIGVADNGEIKGIKTGKETLQNWANQIKLNTTPSLFPDLSQLAFEGKNIVTIAVNEYPIKPVCCKGKYFRRVKNSNHLMSISEISDLHYKTFNRSWDYYHDPNHKLEEISIEKVDLFIRQANKVRPYPINDDPLTVLKKFELIKDEKLTNGCFLLFMSGESSAGTIEAGHFSNETVIKDSITNKDRLCEARATIYPVVGQAR